MARSIISAHPEFLHGAQQTQSTHHARCRALTEPRDGFLHPQFYSDATHANSGYGALVIDQISAITENALDEPARD